MREITLLFLFVIALNVSAQKNIFEENGNDKITNESVIDKSISKKNNSQAFSNNQMVNSEKQPKEEFKVFPNPVNNGEVYITNSIKELLSVQIYDITGKLLKNTKTVDKVNVSELSTGIYVMKIQSNGQSIARKIIIK